MKRPASIVLMGQPDEEKRTGDNPLVVNDVLSSFKSAAGGVLWRGAGQCDSQGAAEERWLLLPDVVD
jgi:hypothetical protein